ncbi:MAG: class I SAM-dependent methyltransferase [Candidatus Edwardsbacteria bacterium]|nr:class I SAM-dependent methyltransferase [Candidatus Edwardsbacteria bacterium]
MTNSPEIPQPTKNPALVKPPRRAISDSQLVANWLIEKVQYLERSYLAYDEPWRQSGFSGPEDRWDACRKPVAECMDKAGAFLDIGCANGYLLESVMHWKKEAGIEIAPYGLDAGGKLVALARQRLPQFADNFFAGNAWDWEPPRMFDFVRTELVYVPPVLRKRYITRLLQEFVVSGGRLLVAEYRSRNHPFHTPWADAALRRWGFAVAFTRSGFWENRELTRVAVIEKK